MQQGEGTDPLREALEDIANRPTVERNPDGDDQAATTMQLIAREALAVAPGPEWEYRVIYPDGSVTYPTTLELAVKWATRGGGYVERRTARRRKVGPWEALPDAE